MSKLARPGRDPSPRRRHLFERVTTGLCGALMIALASDDLHAHGLPIFDSLVIPSSVVVLMITATYFAGLDNGEVAS